MIEFRIDTEAGNLILNYPAHLGLNQEVIPVKSNRDAMGLWRLRVRSYVMNTMINYYKNRTAALSENLTEEKQEALKKIQETLLDNYEGKLLENFLWKVMLTAEYVVKVAPSQSSKHSAYFNTVILPLFEWMEQYLLHMINCKKNN